MKTVSQDETRDKVNLIESLYLYSDLSIMNISKAVKIDVNQVQKIIHNLLKVDALKAVNEQKNTPVDAIMSRDAQSLDCSKTLLDAAAFMIEKGTGCIVVTQDGKPFGIITERDIVCETAFSRRKAEDLTLKVVASRPLIHVSPLETIGNVVDLMIKNNIRRVPVVRDEILVGMVVTKDLAALLLPQRKNLARTILDAISRSRKH